jgi:hypothetical protein
MSSGRSMRGGEWSPGWRGASFATNPAAMAQRQSYMRSSSSFSNSFNSRCRLNCRHYSCFDSSHSYTDSSYSNNQSSSYNTGPSSNEVRWEETGEEIEGKETSEEEY